MYKDASLPQQHWAFDSAHGTLTNEGSGGIIGTEEFHTDANIHTFDTDDHTNKLRW